MAISRKVTVGAGLRRRFNWRRSNGRNCGFLRFRQLKKKMFLLIICILAAGGSGFVVAGEGRIIENHAFGVFTTAGGQVIISLQNDNCLGHYRIASGKTILSEGIVDFRTLPVTNIPFGENNLRIACTADNRLKILIR